jgi:membrane associated rhomboid family serine protease
VGLYDRDYYREQRPGFTLRAPQTVVSALILINVAIWVVDFLTEAHWLGNAMAVGPDTLTHPLRWWQYLTYAFAHSANPFHILWNMVALYFFGYEIENAYGRKEFLRFYLVTAVFAAVVWNLVNRFAGTNSASVVGASGAITGVVLLYALNFPQRRVLFFILPMPAWLLAVIVVAGDMWGALREDGASNVAYVVHLGGAAFAGLYFWQHWNLTRWTDGLATQVRALRHRRPKLHSHHVEDEEPADFSVEVDRILEKIYREGEASLTAKERRTLEAASREYQRRGRVGGGKRNS